MQHTGAPKLSTSRSTYVRSQLRRRPGSSRRARTVRRTAGSSATCAAAPTSAWPPSGIGRRLGVRALGGSVSHWLHGQRRVLPFLHGAFAQHVVGRWPRAQRCPKPTPHKHRAGKRSRKRGALPPRGQRGLSRARQTRVPRAADARIRRPRAQRGRAPGVRRPDERAALQAGRRQLVGLGQVRRGGHRGRGRRARPHHGVQHSGRVLLDGREQVHRLADPDGKLDPRGLRRRHPRPRVHAADQGLPVRAPPRSRRAPRRLAPRESSSGRETTRRWRARRRTPARATVSSAAGTRRRPSG